MRRYSLAGVNDFGHTSVFAKTAGGEAMSFLENLQQFDVELADFFITLASAGLLLVLLLACLCAPFLAALTESAYTLRRKIFYDKCALQITQAALTLGLLLFSVAGGSGLFFLYRQRPELFQPVPQWDGLLPYVLPCALPLAALLLLALYLATWNVLKKLRPLHIFLGLCAALFCLAVLFGGFLFLSALQEPFLSLIFRAAPLTVVQALLLDFLDSPAMWLSLAYLFSFGLAACGSLSQIWLIARRARADYGRDYYVFAMHYCARIALIFTLAASALAGAIFWRLRQSVPPELGQAQDPGILLIAAGLPLSCCLLWLCMIKSDTPLRHKPGAFFAFLFLFIALCAHLMLFFSAFPLT